MPLVDSLLIDSQALCERCPERLVPGGVFLELIFKYLHLVFLQLVSQLLHLYLLCGGVWLFLWLIALLVCREVWERVIICDSGQGDKLG